MPSTFRTEHPGRRGTHFHTPLPPSSEDILQFLKIPINTEAKIRSVLTLAVAVGFFFSVKIDQWHLYRSFYIFFCQENGGLSSFS